MVTRQPIPFPEALRCAVDQWAVATLAASILWARSLGRASVIAAQRQRLATLVRYVRTHSPYYRRAWRHLPEAPVVLADLPAVTKGELMTAFDDWCTDRAIAWRDVERFTAARDHIGEPFRDRYLVWTSSGTTGTPGVFIQDAAALAAYDALVSVQFLGSAFGGYDPGRAAAQGGRAALVTADCDHFASIASWRRAAQGKPWLDMKSFAVTRPLPEIVAALNAYRPAFISSYPTVLALLAEEFSAGRLAVQPAGLLAGGEVLSSATRAAIEDAFGCPLHNEYGASECLTIGHGCRAGALHVNADWVILEPVDRDLRPTPPGELSHTVLLTNLANRIQPIIRYDLGDRVRELAAPCACGSPLPAIQVEGRCDDIVVLVTRSGERIRLPPMALATVVENAAGLVRFQIVQSAAQRLLLRVGSATRALSGPKAILALRAYLDAQGLANIDVRLDERDPQPEPHDGKLRQVLALRT
jgi:phenylacetate-CoA ligase